MECDRPGRADGAVAGEAGRRRRVLDRRLERLSRLPRAAPQAHPRDASEQSGRHRRRHPLLLRQRPADRFRRSGRAVVATEFVGTSISSYGPPYDVVARLLPDNPHVHFFESRRRGYVCVDSNARTCRCACASSPTRPIPRRISRRCRLSRWKQAIRGWRRRKHLAECSKAAARPSAATPRRPPSPRRARH